MTAFSHRNSIRIELYPFEQHHSFGFEIWKYFGNLFPFFIPLFFAFSLSLFSKWNTVGFTFECQNIRCWNFKRSRQKKLCFNHCFKQSKLFRLIIGLVFNCEYFSSSKTTVYQQLGTTWSIHWTSPIINSQWCFQFWNDCFWSVDRNYSMDSNQWIFDSKSFTWRCIEFIWVNLTHFNNKTQKGKRPRIPSESPPNIKKLIEGSWKQDPNKRITSFQLIHYLTDFSLLQEQPLDSQTIQQKILENKSKEENEKQQEFEEILSQLNEKEKQLINNIQPDQITFEDDGFGRRITLGEGVSGSVFLGRYQGGNVAIKEIHSDVHFLIPVNFE